MTTQISNGVKILTIGSDRALFRENSKVRKRIIDYGKLAGEMHIVVFSLKKQNFQLKPRLRISDNVFVYPTNSKVKWFYIFDAYKIAKTILTASGRWLVTSQDPFESGSVGWLIKRKFKIQLQLQIHTDFLSPYFWKESFLNKIRVLLAKFLIHRADCIRVVSERIKRSFLYPKPHTLNPIVVLPIFVDIKEIQTAPITVNLHQKYPQFDFIILMASRLTREKNIGLAISAMAEVVKKYPKTGLIIVGEGPEKENQKSKIKYQKLENNIILESSLPFEQLISYYKTADLFLLTSNYEGYGRSVVEAMATGCPVIMTDVGLAGEVLVNEKSGLVAPVNDDKKLSETILKLIENEELRNNFALSGKKIVDSWSAKDEYFKNYQSAWQNCFK